jgi:hypothetical protein
MRLSEFWERMGARFGVTYAESLARDMVLGELGGRTVEQALEAGAKPAGVWRAVCEAFEIPAKDR